MQQKFALASDLSRNFHLWVKDLLNLERRSIKNLISKKEKKNSLSKIELQDSLERPILISTEILFDPILTLKVELVETNSSVLK